MSIFFFFNTLMWLTTFGFVIYPTVLKERSKRKAAVFYRGVMVSVMVTWFTFVGMIFSILEIFSWI